MTFLGPMLDVLCASHNCILKKNWFNMNWIFLLCYSALSLLIANLSVSLTALMLPSEIAIPIVKNVSTNLSNDGFPSNIYISISRYNLILHLNEFLISPHFYSTVIEKYNKQTTRQRLKNCYYQGRLEPFKYNRNIFHYWNAAISLCQGLQGHFGNSMDGYIVVFPNQVHANTLHQQHYLYHELENVMFAFNIDPLQIQHSDDLFSFYQQKQLAKHPFIELQIVNDKYIYDKYDKDVDKLEYINAVVINDVDQLFNSLGIDVVIISIVTWTNENMVDGYDDSSNLLLNFSFYNMNFMPYKYDIAILFSSFQFEDILGNSFIGGACDIFNAVFIGMKSTKVYFIASVIAHELGHMLNMSHDEDYPVGECICHDLTGKCIMKNLLFEASVSRKWSTCSRKVAEITLRNESYRCLFITFGGEKCVLIQTFLNLIIKLCVCILLLDPRI